MSKISVDTLTIKRREDLHLLKNTHPFEPSNVELYYLFYCSAQIAFPYSFEQMKFLLPILAIFGQFMTKHIISTAQEI